MACTDKYKHVCFGDLEEYLRRDSYFSDFSKNEIDTIRRNLGFTTTLEDFNVIEDSHEHIYTRLLNGKLNVSCVYVINDFRTLYLIDNKVCGLDDFLPSKLYKIMLKPSSPSSFDKNVYILTNDYDTSKWVVQYDITPNKLAEGILSRGTITYLCDLYNNSAYYDFKNIRFKKTRDELNKGAESYTDDAYLYTFDMGGKECSEFCINNKLGPECTYNVFLGKAVNNTLEAECHNNLFFSLAVNNTFKFGTYNNYFKNPVVKCSGVVHDKELGEITSSDTVKQFDYVNNELVIMYIDPQTLTYLIYQI